MSYLSSRHVSTQACTFTSQFSAMSTAAAKKPTFVNVHGAWHRPVHGEKLAAVMEAHGYRMVSVALPSSVEPGAEIPDDCQPDVDVIRKAVLEELDNGLDVIVVTHSYGGIPGTSALRGLDAASRKKAGFNTSVAALAGMATFFVPEGCTVLEGQEPNSPSIADPNIKAALPLKDPGPIHTFYHDLAKDEAERYAAALRPMSLPALMSPNQFAAYEVIPTHYLLCTEDRAILYNGQRRMTQRIKNAGSFIRVETVKCGHSPFLSMPERTAEFLRRTAGEQILE